MPHFHSCAASATRQDPPAHRPEIKIPMLGTDIAKDTEVPLDSSLAIVGRPGSGATITAIRLAAAYLSSGHSVLFLDRSGDLLKPYTALAQPVTERIPADDASKSSCIWPIAAILDRLFAAPSHEYVDLRGESRTGIGWASVNITHWLSLNYRSGVRPDHRIMLVMDYFSPELMPDFLHIMELGRDYFYLVMTMTDTAWLSPESSIIRANARQRLFLSTSPQLLSAEIGDFVSFSQGETTKATPADMDLKPGTGWCSGSCGHAVIRLS